MTLMMTLRNDPPSKKEVITYPSLRYINTLDGTLKYLLIFYSETDGYILVDKFNLQNNSREGKKISHYTDMPSVATSYYLYKGAITLWNVNL